jgi:peptidoglycan hydrolase-like protein with peptidoglycan-binding domain
VTVSPRIIAQDFTCTEKAGQNLKALLVDANGTKIDNVPVEFHIVGKTYSRHTDDAGNASLPIRLRKGTYDCTITSYNTSVKVKVTCVEHKKTATTLQGTDLNKKQGGTESYKCRLTYKNNAGKVCGLAGREVQIVLHKVTYKRKTDANGYADLPVNLTAGNYVAHTIFRGDDDYLPSERTNKIVIKKTNKTYNAVRFYQQNNGVNCGPTSLEICSQILGNHISQDKFAEWCNTGSNGTSPADLISGARKGGFKLTEIPRTFKAVSDAIESKSPVIYHHWTGGLSCMNWVNGYGHYAVIYEWSDNPNRFYICDPTKGLGVCSPSAIISASYNFYKVEKI